MTNRIPKILAAAALFVSIVTASTIVVSSGQNLNTIINGAQGGDTVLVNPGTYAAVSLANKRCSASAPLIIKKGTSGTGEARIYQSGTSGYLFHITGCSYIAVDGLTLEGAMFGFYVESSDHLIIRGCEVRSTGQEAIHIRIASTWFDIIGNTIYNTGLLNSQWAEGIYIGTGNYPGDTLEHGWIYGNTVHHTGNAEGINIKPDVFHITVRKNNVHDITPGTTTQYNQSGITVEMGGTIRLTEDRDVWIDSNEIYNVKLGQWANGIMCGGTGVYVLRNNIHDCQENGVYVNSFSTLGRPVYVFGNSMNNNTKNYQFDGGVNVIQRDTTPNPNKPQQWYLPATPVSVRARNQMHEKQTVQNSMVLMSPKRSDFGYQATGVKALCSYRLFDMRGSLFDHRDIYRRGGSRPAPTVDIKH